MATLDIFNNDAFSVVSMTRSIERVPFYPSWLGSLNLFNVERLTTTFAGIERREGKVSLIGTTERGGPPELGDIDERNIVPINVPRLAKRKRQQAHSIQNVRAFGNMTEMAGVQDAVVRIQTQLRRDLELTMEFHRLGAVQGKLYDANGRLLLDMFKTFGVDEPAEINFELDIDDTNIRAKCNQVRRGMDLASKGAIPPGARVIGMCGDEFFDALVMHPTVMETYKYQEGSRLRESTMYTEFTYGGITFVNYRSSDDGKVGIPAQSCRFFPVGAPDVFSVAYAPFEAAEFVNTPGQDVYAIVVWDQERRFWWQPEIYSYPLHYCAIPEVLFRARMT